MYSEYVKCSDELEVGKAENLRLNDYLDQILEVSTEITGLTFYTGQQTLSQWLYCRASKVMTWSKFHTAA